MAPFFCSDFQRGIRSKDQPATSDAVLSAMRAPSMSSFRPALTGWDITKNSQLIFSEHRYATCSGQICAAGLDLPEQPSGNVMNRGRKTGWGEKN